MNLRILFLFLAISVTEAKAQDVMPATADDLQAFDQILEKQKSNEVELGSEVSSEAKRLKADSGKKGRQNFGQWVRAQKEKEESKGKGTKSGQESATKKSKNEKRKKNH